MSDLHELEPPAVRRDGKARLFDLRTRREIHLSPSTALLSEAHEGGQQDDRSENTLAEQTRTLEQQIAQIDRLAEQHYPDDQAGRSAYKSQLLMQRLREYHAKAEALEAELATAVDFIGLKVKEQ